MRGCSLAGGREKYTSFGVLPCNLSRHFARLVAAGGIKKEGEEMAEVTFLGVQRVGGTGGAFQRQVQVEPGDQTLAFVGRD